MGITWSGLRKELVVCPPPPDWPKTEPLPAFVEAIDLNNTLKAISAASLALVPEAGGILSVVLKVLWPDTEKPTLKWDQIKEGVKTIAQGLITEHEANDLRNRTEGLMNQMQKYARTSYDSPQKGDFFDDIISWFNANRSWYLNDEAPWLTLQLFMQMATVHLMVLREQAYNFEKIFGASSNHGHVDAAAHRQELKDALAVYLAQIDKIRQKCLEWRRSKISKTKWEKDGNNPFNQVKKCTVTDGFTGFHREYNSNTQYYYPERDYGNLLDYVDIAYRDEIEWYLSLSLCWPNLAVENKHDWVAYTQTPYMDTRIAGHGAYPMSHFNDREFFLQHGPITKVEIHAWDGVDGIEVWYGGQSSGLRGKRGGTVRTLDVGPGENIVCVSGHIGTVVDTIKFQVNKGKKIGGGGNRAGYPTADDTFRLGSDTDGPLDWDLKLAYLYGWYTGDQNTFEGRGWVQQLGAVMVGKQNLMDPDRALAGLKLQSMSL